MQEDKNKIKKIIVKELIYIGYDISLYGTQYLLEAIYIVIENDIEDTINLKKEIYPKLANKHKKSINDIKCSINYATKSMYNRNDMKFLMKYFNFYQNMRPTIKQVIYTVLNKIS